MLILGIDPGVTTGLALYDEVEGVKKAVDVQSPTAIYDELRELSLAVVDDRAVVIESYVGAGPRTAEAVHTIKVFGFVEFLCLSWGLTLFQQAPQQRKHQLANSSMLLPDGPHHAKDALAHALSFLAIGV